MNMNWINVCWNNFVKSAHIYDKLTKDDIEYLYYSTVEVGERLDEYLSYMCIDPTNLPIINFSDGRVLYVNSYKLCPSNKNFDDIARDIARLFTAKKHDIFSPYMLLVPASCDGKSINRQFLMTRFASYLRRKVDEEL